MKHLTRGDPFRTMRRWDPFEELRSMRHEMDRLFDRFLGTGVSNEHEMLWMPSAESYAKDNKFVFRAELPGLDPKDLDISITDRELLIKGERKAEKDARGEHYFYQEINYGSFERRFVLPEGIKTDDLKATFSNGIIEITMPLLGVAKARKIEIEAPKEEKKHLKIEPPEKEKKQIETGLDIAA